MVKIYVICVVFMSQWECHTVANMSHMTVPALFS